MIFNRILYSLFFWTASISVLPAAEPDPVLMVSVDFSVVGWGTSFNELDYRDGGKMKSLRVPVFARSAAMHYTGKPALELFLKQEKDGKKVNVMVAAPEINPDDKRVIILLAPPVEGKSLTKVLRFPKEQFVGGVLRIFNLSPVRMAVKGTTGATVLAPDSFQLFKPVEGGLTFITAYEESGSWQRLHELRLPIPADQEITLIYFKSDLDMFQSRGGIQDPIQSITLQETKPVTAQEPPLLSQAGR